jgi:hypothetical protein
MRALVLGAVIVLSAPGAQEQQEPTLEAELEALVAATNAHDSFRLLYRGTSEAGGDASDMTLEIVHRDPDRAGFRLAAGDEGVEVLVDGFDYFLREARTDASWGRARVPESKTLAVFDELLPTPGALEPGVMLNLRVVDGLKLSMSWSFLGRRAVLGFFSTMLQDPESVRREEAGLVWSDGALTLTISRESGFPERIEIMVGEKRLDLRLEVAEMDVDLDERLAVPEDARAAAPDPGLQAAFDSLYARHSARQAAFVRLDHQLREGLRELDADTRARFESFLEVLHAELMDMQWSAWLASLRAFTDEFTDWARKTGDREVVAPHAEERRAKLEAGFDESLKKYHGALSDLASGDIEDELFEIEREVVERLHAERVSGPILAYFDEQLGAALGD